MLTFFKALDSLVWGAPLLVLLVGTGIYLSTRLRLLQVLKLPLAFKLIFAEDKGEGDISSFAALATALAATVGTGNIVGVATAIKAGGPGALFWMWIAAFFGMATKYAEGLLAIKYRTKDANGEVSGGPMYYIINGMGKKWKPLAIFFALAGILVAFLGIGTFSQVNSITASLKNSFNWSPQIVSILIAIVVAVIIFGGIQSIAKVSEKLVPFMAAAYIIATLIVIFMHYNHIIPAIEQVFSGAFTGTAAVGGFAGVVVKEAIQNGIARGVFSNESGLGSAPIAAAAAKTHEPAEQGLISMTGTFIDTLVICTLTGLSILVTGKWTVKGLEGAPLTQSAFATVFGNIGVLVLTLCLVLFAFTTILGWSYYGERCFEFLFGVKHINIYRSIFIIMVALGGFLELDLIWTIADIVNGLMAIPNLIALLALSPIIIAETRNYFKRKNKSFIKTKTRLG
ncbi:alanine/glycine:cation symporter family protein [Streptococcus mutans]|jgi:amino acid carrier protein|uniref:Sodium/amino acid (Alanine) symporter n=1 Tax=Streptococcus mutans serotype c (strain ATCC 700610 / UA159) TaxID=210007 RepID=Q8CWX5_STRMU|nr:sodium:alanine symporter family protein [Streptococcus mutans]RKV75478.1 MAG: sodium:alanine symporter family protein [Streptococcus sp.]AAN58866.1 putative sodium/amino acid (alanine) symporter [Streptococcus mutans UA159]AJD55500.1 sodium/amino acid (alanine) symporter [Streptococcus mutans UA159-FR]EMB59955.1 putative sodium/amino acid (alanine) symporter [Streptococcus mutans 8ID3]EMC62174.1 putative sodium/amino acid (alanine) symporter [Streptococcus mutans U2B]